MYWALRRYSAAGSDKVAVITDEAIEIPTGKRTKFYRLFEMLPAVISYGSIILFIVLAWWNAFAASIYLLAIILTVLARAVFIAAYTIRGYHRLKGADGVDWRGRLEELRDPETSLRYWDGRESVAFGHEIHLDNLARLQDAEASRPTPDDIHHVVIVAAYNEGLDVIEPTIQALVDTTIAKDHLDIVFAYEERGGEGIAATALTLQRRYGDRFNNFYLVKHPKDLPGEVVGKGGNIVYAGEFIAQELEHRGVDDSNVIITTLDCDNRPHPGYLDYVSYEFIVHDDRQRLSYQPVSLFLNNIWDVPAPMRVLATGNSFWNIISSMRPHMLRNFASHSQPLKALKDMNFWSKRTIVEDGHQYWRSYFHFNGNYGVTPIYVPIYQDAVLSDTYKKTLVAQFKQLRRWAYGASDVPYVASQIVHRWKKLPKIDAITKFFELIDSHVTLATVSILITVGGWVPLLVNAEAARSLAAHQLPVVVSGLQQVAMIGLFISIFLSFKMLPPRPERYKRHRTIFMVLQWFLMPVTSVFYGALSALTAQTYLFLGKYLDKFDVTEKVTVQAKESKKQ